MLRHIAERPQWHTPCGDAAMPSKGSGLNLTDAEKSYRRGRWRR